MHTWDVAVALDPAARLAADGVDLLAGTLGQFAGPLGKPQGDHFRVAVHATSPRRELLLTVADSVELTDDDAGEPAGSPAAGQSAQVSQADGELRLPCEAFIRLMFGRLDPLPHTRRGCRRRSEPRQAACRVSWVLTLPGGLAALVRLPSASPQGRRLG